MARLCRPAEISLRVDTQRIAKDAVIIVMTGDNIGHMLATALHKGPVLSKEGLPPIRHSDTSNRPSRLGGWTGKVLVGPLLPQ
ncbi:MAG: hypothetical protein RLZ25_1254 [Pseudomonadota bacterium]|jgi:hypothetical protein